MYRVGALPLVLVVVLAGCAAGIGTDASPSPSPPPTTVPDGVVGEASVVTTVTASGPYEDAELRVRLFYVANGTWYRVGPDGDPAEPVPEAARTAAGTTFVPTSGYVWKVTVAADTDGQWTDHGPASLVVDGESGRVLAHHVAVADESEGASEDDEPASTAVEPSAFDWLAGKLL